MKCLLLTHKQVRVARARVSAAFRFVFFLMRGSVGLCFIYLFTYLLTYLVIYSFVRSFVRLFLCCVTYMNYKTD